MTVLRVQNSDAKKLEHFLSGHIETSMFLLSNMRRSGLEYKDKEYHGNYLGHVDEAGNFTGVLAHYWNGIIIVQTSDDFSLGKLITVFCDGETRPVAGVLGADGQAKTVIKRLGLSGEAFATNRSEGLYALDLDRLSLPLDFDYSRSKLVEAKRLDRVVLKRWIKAYEIETLGSEDDGALEKHVQNRVERIFGDTDCWALLNDGSPVSLCGFNARLPEIVQIGPVYTPPEYRNRGFARVLVGLTLQKVKEQGVRKAILFTDNPAATKAYLAIGFEKIGSYRIALLKQPIELKEHLEK